MPGETSDIEMRDRRTRLSTNRFVLRAMYYPWMASLYHLRRVVTATALRALAIPFAALVIIAAAACGANGASKLTPLATSEANAPPTAPVATSPTAVATPGQSLTTGPSDIRRRILAEGEFRLTAAGSFGQPGFHEVLVATHSLPPELDVTAGNRLVLRLRDAGRTQQACSREHPLSGCATVDWSDIEGRPGVPQSGVFENSVTVELASGSHTLYLTEEGTLADEPNKYAPG